MEHGVVIVHLDPGHQSELPKILATRTRMPVAQVVGRVALEPRHVYVIPPNRQLLATDHHLALAEFDEPRWQRAPIDIFFRSLAGQHGDDFAIILSGAGSDGSVGIKAVKEAGGIILVQDPEEAEYGSMPRNAIATGMADFVLPVRELAERLPGLIRDRRSPNAGALSETDGESMRRILSYLRVRSGHDFANYKKSTVSRRIARRMQVHRTDTLAAYLLILRGNPGEAELLGPRFLEADNTGLDTSESMLEHARARSPRASSSRRTSSTGCLRRRRLSFLPMARWTSCPTTTCSFPASQRRSNPAVFSLSRCPRRRASPRMR